MDIPVKFSSSLISTHSSRYSLMSIRLSMLSVDRLCYFSPDCCSQCVYRFLACPKYIFFPYMSNGYSVRIIIQCALFSALSKPPESPNGDDSRRSKSGQY